MAKRRAAGDPIPIPLDMSRGMWSGGDGARLPLGYARTIRNMRRVDGVWKKRAPFVFDGLTSIQGLASWDDDVNKMTRLVAIADDGSLRVKDIGAETWGLPATGTVSGARLQASASYRGKLWGALDDGTGVPVGIFSYDGTTVDTSPLTSAIVGRMLLFAKDRLFIFHPRVTIDNLLPWQAAYSAAGGLWQLSSVSARDIVAGSTTIGEVIPTADTGAYLYRDVETVTASTEAQRRNWSCAIHNTSANYQMPITLQVQLSNPWRASTAYLKDEIVTPTTDNGYLYRAIVAGASAVTEPASWPVIISDTVVDGAVTWLCYSENVLGEQKKLFVPTASIEPGARRFFVEAQLPPTPGTYVARIYIKFGNESSPTITRVALHIGFRDGLPDGDSSKENYGQQVTAGDYFFPFFNVETNVAPVKDLDATIWSEVADPSRFRAISSYSQGGTAGYTQGAVWFDGRLFIFKRRSYTKLVFVESEVLVVLPEGDETLGIGVIGPAALDIHKGVLYGIGEDYVWALKAGSNQIPRDICGDGMRAEIMDRGSDWVEDQAAGLNTPRLVIDHKRQLVYVKTQRGRAFVYSITNDAWSRDESGGSASLDPAGYDTRTMAYHPETQKMYASFGASGTGTSGLSRLDEDAAGAQNGLTMTGQASFDGGATYAHEISAVLSSAVHENFVPIDVPIYQSWNAIQTRVLITGGPEDQISTSGALPIFVEIAPRAIESTNPHTDVQLDMLRLRCKEGADEFAVSDVSAVVSVSEFFQRSQPTFGASTL